MSDLKTIGVSTDERGITRITLARPEVRNAINAELIGELTRAFEALNQNSAVRGIVLCGEGKVFCAGADINWMRSVQGQTRDEVAADSRRLQHLFRVVGESPKPTFCRIQGGAYAGAMGLVAGCDVVAATRDARFSVSEVRLGLIPAVISTFLVPKVGPSWARYLAVSAAVIDAEQAQRAGLVHEVVDDEAGLDEAETRHVGLMLSASPDAIASCKALLRSVLSLSGDAVLDDTLERNVKMRFSEAGQEGMAAFLERRKPAWARD